MMKPSMLFKHGPLPPKSNLHPPDIIHVISVPSPSPFFYCSSASMYYTECKPKNKSGGGLRMRLHANHQLSTSDL